MFIRRLKEEDAPVVSSMIARNFLEVNVKDYPKEEMERLAQMYNAEKVLEINRFAHTYVACFDDLVVGCGSIASFGGKEDESILLSVFVLPEYQGTGIGKKIIKTLEMDEFFSRAKRIEIPSSITGCTFYRKLGYDYKDGIKILGEDGLYRLEKWNTHSVNGM